MTLLINPGSGPIRDGEGWTNTVLEAWKRAREWHSNMHQEGLTDIALSPIAVQDTTGRWRFEFVHAVTGVSVVLETHGIDDLDAYEKAHIFPPRVYWNGSSSSTPCLDDWKREGFEPVQTYRRKS